MTKLQKGYWVAVAVALGILGFVARSQHLELKELKKSVITVNDRSLNNTAKVTDVLNNDGRRVMAVNAVDQRLQNVEAWIYEFNDIMFGPAESPSTNNVGE